MNTTSWYNQRVSEELRYKISTVISERVRDPRIPPMTSITGIKLAADNHNATVFASIPGDKQTLKNAIDALNHAAPFIQRTVAPSMNIRFFPKLYFKADTSIEHGNHINELLKEVKNDLEQP